MTLAVLKLSYNSPGEPTVTGGICGAAFLIGRRTAVTAHHILSSDSFGPNPGYRKCQYWILSRNGKRYELNKSRLSGYPSIDTTVIRFSTSLELPHFRMASKAPSVGESLRNEGYVEKMPRIEATWEGQRLRIRRHDLSTVIAGGGGHIEFLGKITLSSNDVNLNNIEVIKTSYPGCKGMSVGRWFGRRR